MKNNILHIILLFSILCCFNVTKVYAQEKEQIVFYPQWMPQSQFLGFYVAQEKGFYDEEGLDVEIKHIGMNENETLMDKLIDGEADIVGQQLMQSIVSRSKGNRIVNVMQLTQDCGLCCVANKPLNSPSDLNGLKISRWSSGYAEIIEIIQHDMQLNIQWIPSFSSTNLFIYNAVDAVLCFTYSEYLKILFAKGSLPDQNVLHFSDFGFNYPEDGLYVTEAYYNTHQDAIKRFVKATIKGWQYVNKHPDEAIQFVYRYTEANHISTNITFQKSMLEEYLRLQVNPATNKIDFAPVTETIFNEMVKKLKDNKLIENTVNYKEFVK